MCRNRIFWLLFFALLSVATAVEAQKFRSSRSAIDSLHKMLQMQPDESILCFERSTVDIGVMYDTVAPYVAELKFRNVSGRDLKIEKVKATCGCIDTEFMPSLVAAGASGVIKVKFNPKGQAGTIDKRVFIYTSLSNSTPATCVILKGNVVGADEWDFLPHRVGTLRLKTKEVLFDNVQKSQSPSMRIMCANVGVKPLILTEEIAAPYASFSVEPRVLEPGFTGDIIITLDGSKIPEFTDECRSSVIFGGVKGAPSERTIKVIIKKEDNKN